MQYRGKGHGIRSVASVLCFSLKGGLARLRCVRAEALLNAAASHPPQLLHKAVLLTYRIHRESNNSFKCDYNHRGLLFLQLQSYGKKQQVQSQSSVYWSAIYMLYSHCEQCNNTHKCIKTVLINVVGDATSVNHYTLTQGQANIQVNSVQLLVIFQQFYTVWFHYPGEGN